MIFLRNQVPLRLKDILAWFTSGRLPFEERRSSSFSQIALNSDTHDARGFLLYYISLLGGGVPSDLDKGLAAGLLS